MAQLLVLQCHNPTIICIEAETDRYIVTSAHIPLLLAQNKTRVLAIPVLLGGGYQ